MRRSSRWNAVRRMGLVFGLWAALLPAGPVVVAASSAADPAANVAPVANNDFMYAFTGEGYQDLYILDNDTDADGDTLVLTEVTPAQHGSSACCLAGGNYYYAAYKPFAGYSGADWFTYTVSDGHGHTDTAIVNITVAASGTFTGTGRVAIHGGPQDRLTLVVTQKAGGPTSATAGACNNTTAGLGIEDAVIEPGNATYYNAFDNGLTFWLNNTQLPPHSPLSVTHRNLASGPLSVEGLSVGLAYFGVRESFTLRTLLSLTNNTGATQAVTVTVATNVGSDANTGIRGTSSGDLAFTNTDRWVVTSDSPLNPGYIVSTHVLWGPGGSVHPDVVGTDVFTCSGNQGIRARFHVTIPANSTRRLLFFNQFHDDNAQAIADAAVFDIRPVGLLEGLGTSQLSQVLNWNIPYITRLYLPFTIRP